MATNTYTVKKGDTLSAIANKYKAEYGYTNTYTYVDELVKINDITNPNYIVVGQVIKLTGTPAPTSNNSWGNVVKIKLVGLQSKPDPGYSDRTVYTTWIWTKENTENYSVEWEYYTGDKDGDGNAVWFEGSTATVTDKQSVYDAPANALKVRVRVKPNSKKRKVNGKETTYWDGKWCTRTGYDFAKNPPSKLDKPSVELDGRKLTMSLTNVPSNVAIVYFEVTKDNTSVVKTQKVAVKTRSASYTYTIASAGEYKVRCYAIGGNDQSGDWSDYSDSKSTIPDTPKKLTKCSASTDTSIYLEWASTNGAKEYDIQYAENKDYFDASGDVTTVNAGDTTKYTITKLTSGKEYFFRIRAKNTSGESEWSEISSVIIGKDPVAPTTWSSITTAIKGEPVTLYWVHNSEDGSTQTYATLSLEINGVVEEFNIENKIDEQNISTVKLYDKLDHLTILKKEEKEDTSACTIDTSKMEAGATIRWKVRTKGVTERYSAYSAQRIIDVHEQPRLELQVTNRDNSVFTVLNAFPIKLSAVAYPKTQAPIGYHVSVIANDSYTTVDGAGNEMPVNSGTPVYSKYFDGDEDLTQDRSLSIALSAGDLNLENDVEYTIRCVVSMNSGLTGEASTDFTVAWIDTVEYEPTAEIGLDSDTVSVQIRPYCVDENESLIPNLMLSVYRREFDGSFTKLMDGLDNMKNTFLTDPHPSLDYARYRIVAMNTETGAITYTDLPGYPVGENAVIIQWDEQWSSFENFSEDPLATPPWVGSLLKIPYNIDVSDSHKPDVALVEYIGRKHPVSYYGTQLGETSTWSVVIPKDDRETLYALRRLAVWMGNVYVREPSGSGYWANVTVSFSQKHKDLTIPVTLNVTRVEGGA